MKKAAVYFQKYASLAYAMTATSVVGVEENNRTLLRKPKAKTLFALVLPTATRNTCGCLVRQKRWLCVGSGGKTLLLHLQTTCPGVQERNKGRLLEWVRCGCTGVALCVGDLVVG